MKFTTIYSSDLVRAKDTCEVALGFPTISIKEDRRLREIFFGDHENIHFSLLDKE